MTAKLALLLAAITFGGAAHGAVAVSFNTTGAWNCQGISGCLVAGNDLQIGDLTLRYVPNSVLGVMAPEYPASTGIGFGTVSPLCFGSCGTLTSISGATLDITVTTTDVDGMPFNLFGVWNGVLSGALSSTQSLDPAIAFFSPVWFHLSDGQVELHYRLQQPLLEDEVEGYILNSVGDVPTSFQGTVSGSGVPEPGGSWLMGFGLLGLGLIRFRRLS